MNDQVSESESESESEVEAADWRDSFWWRWRYIFFLAPIALALLFYAAIPTLFRHAASAMGTRLGLSELQIETGYPRLDALNVHRLELIGDGFRLQAMVVGCPTIPVICCAGASNPCLSIASS